MDRSTGTRCDSKRQCRPFFLYQKIESVKDSEYISVTSRTSTVTLVFWSFTCVPVQLHIHTRAHTVRTHTHTHTHTHHATFVCRSLAGRPSFLCHQEDASCRRRLPCVVTDRGSAPRPWTVTADPTSPVRIQETWPITARCWRVEQAICGC